MKQCKTCVHALVTTIKNHSAFTHNGVEHPPETVTEYECHYNAPIHGAFCWPRVHAIDFCSKWADKTNYPVYDPFNKEDM